MTATSRKLIKAAERWRHGALNAVMPPVCPLSGEPLAVAGAIAPEAWTGLQFIDDPICRGCSSPFAADYGEGAMCGRCIAEPPAYDWARAALVYNDAAGKLVSGLKFKDRLELAPMLGGWLARISRHEIGPCTIIAPVPLHWRRLASRRFNQAALLADGAARALGREVGPDLLLRVRATPPQKEIASPVGRQRNVAGAFAVKEKWRARIAGADIVLVDDVLTTGATLNACARTLRRAGASRIGALVLARVVKDGQVAI